MNDFLTGIKELNFGSKYFLLLLYDYENGEDYEHVKEVRHAIKVGFRGTIMIVKKFQFLFQKNKQIINKNL